MQAVTIPENNTLYFVGNCINSDFKRTSPICPNNTVFYGYIAAFFGVPTDLPLDAYTIIKVSEKAVFYGAVGAIVKIGPVTVISPHANHFYIVKNNVAATCACGGESRGIAEYHALNLNVFAVVEMKSRFYGIEFVKQDLEGIF